MGRAIGIGLLAVLHLLRVLDGLQSMALNPVRIVVMEIHVAGCGLCQFRMLWLEPWEGHLWFELTLYFVLKPPFLHCYIA